MKATIYYHKSPLGANKRASHNCEKLPYNLGL